MDTSLLIWLFGACGAGIAGAFTYARSIQEGAAKTAAAIDDQRGRETEAVAVALADYKVAVTKDFATWSSLRDVETRTLERLNHMDGKLDRLIERSMK